MLHLLLPLHFFPKSHALWIYAMRRATIVHPEALILSWMAHTRMLILLLLLHRPLRHVVLRHVVLCHVVLRHVVLRLWGCKPHTLLR